MNGLLTSTRLPLWAAEVGGAAGVGADKGAGDAAAVAAAAAKANGASLLADDAAGADEPVATHPAKFPENWKEEMGGADKDTLKALERYKSPADVAKALREAQKTIAKGGKGTVAEKPAVEDAAGLKVWREQQGIPDEPTAYKLPEAVTKRITDADKPNVAFFTEAMHKRDAPTSAVTMALETYYDLQDQVQAAIDQGDKQFKTETEDVLREEWGSAYRPNMTLAKRFVEEIMPGVNMLDARLPDGRLVGSVPELVKSLVAMGTMHYGDEAFAGSDAATKTQNRKEELEQMQKTDMNKYNSDPKFRKEYIEILAAEEKRPKR